MLLLLLRDLDQVQLLLEIHSIGIVVVAAVVVFHVDDVVAAVESWNYF